MFSFVNQELKYKNIDLNLIKIIFVCLIFIKSILKRS
jgi:hypothetical protein